MSAGTMKATDPFARLPVRPVSYYNTSKKEEEPKALEAPKDPEPVQGAPNPDPDPNPNPNPIPNPIPNPNPSPIPNPAQLQGAQLDRPPPGLVVLRPPPPIQLCRARGALLADALG